MKAFVLVILSSSCLLAGCSKHSNDQRAQTSEAAREAPPLHKDGEGILLCESTKDSIGLRIVEVSERKEGSEAFLVVPESAVLNTTAGTSVFVENGSYYKRSPVTVGKTFEDMVAITEGLYEGDNVVAEAAQTLWLIELRAVKGGKGCCPMPASAGKTAAH
jgi:hypothetical protein